MTREDIGPAIAWILIILATLYLLAQVIRALVS